jgi:hypothetical protein
MPKGALLINPRLVTLLSGKWPLGPVIIGPEQQRLVINIAKHKGNLMPHYGDARCQLIDCHPCAADHDQCRDNGNYLNRFFSKMLAAQM